MYHHTLNNLMEKVIFFVCFLVKQTFSAIICEKNQRSYGLFGSMGLDNLTVQAFGFSIIVIALAYNLLSPKRNDCARREIEPSSKEYGHQDEGPKMSAEPEYPERHTLDHALFEKTGVEVKLASSHRYRTNAKQLPRDLVLQAFYASEESDLLEENELLLSPVIRLMSSTRLNEMLELSIPHGANMVLSCKKWTVVLKETMPNSKWVSIEETGKDERQGRIKNFVTKSNHVRFDTDHLSTFAIVGKYDRSSLSVFKRMKLAAFCSDAKLGENLLIRIYCFDDCEWSFERVMAKEQKEGGTIVSSIESLNFSVTLENDVKITVNDVAGWQLHQDSSKKLSHKSLKSSFNSIPQGELVFHPRSTTGTSKGFFAAITFNQDSAEKTVLYASATIKKNPAGSVD